MPDTTQTGYPYPEGSDPLTDYPAEAQLLAEFIEKQICTIYDSGALAAPGNLDSGTLVVPAGVRHARIIAKCRGTDAADSSGYIRFNNSALLDYDYAGWGRQSGSIQQTAQYGANAIACASLLPKTGSPAGKFCLLVADVFDAFLVGVAKQIVGQHSCGPVDSSGFGGYSITGSYQPAGLGVISRIAIAQGAGNFAAGSRLIIKGWA